MRWMGGHRRGLRLVQGLVMIAQAAAILRWFVQAMPPSWESGGSWTFWA